MRRYFAPAALLLALAACTVGPDYAPPSVALPVVWPTQGPAQGAAQTAPPLPASPLPDLREWWRELGDARLDALVGSALAGNLDIAQALARIDQARAAAGLARANQLPSAEVNGALARSRQSLDAGLGQIAHYVPSYPRTSDEAQLGLAVGWELDLAGGDRRLREAALANLAGARAGADAARLMVAGAVVDGYIALHVTEARLGLLEQRRVLLTQRLGIMRAQMRLGATGRGAADELEAALARCEAALSPLRAQLAAQRNTLAVLAGQPAGSDLPELVANTAPIFSAPLPEDPAAGLPAQMLRRRPDLRVAEARAVAANAQLGAAMGEYWPKLSLSALIGLDSTRLASFASGPAQVLTGAVGLRWRLLDFARVQAGIDGARGATREALAAYRAAVLQAGAEVEDAYANLASARDAAAARARALAATRVALATSQSAARLGATGQDAVLERRLAVLAAEDDAVVAQGAAWQALAGCYRAIGG